MDDKITTPTLENLLNALEFNATAAHETTALLKDLDEAVARGLYNPAKFGGLSHETFRAGIARSIECAAAIEWALEQVIKGIPAHNGVMDLGRVLVKMPPRTNDKPGSIKNG